MRESLVAVADGEELTNTTLGELMASELKSLGGLEKEEAETTW
jgi:hypothetical protein